MRNKLFIVNCLIFCYSTASAQTLQEAAQASLVENPDILFEVAKNSSTEQGMLQAKGQYYPTLDLRLGAGKEKTDNPITNAIGGSSSNQVLNRKESSIELTQNIFAGYGIVGEVGRNYYLWIAQSFKTAGVAEDLLLDVTERYLSIIKQRRMVSYSKKNLSEHQRLFNMVNDRASAGVSREAELEQARSRLALANATDLAVRNDLRDEEVKFIRLVGQPASNISLPAAPPTKMLPSSLEQAVQRGLDNHPTLKSALADIKEAKKQYLVSKANNFPRLDFIASASRNHNLDGLVGRNDDNLAMLRLSYNLYRGGSDLAGTRQASFQVQEAFEVKTRTVQQIEQKMRLSWYAWKTATARIPFLRTHVSAAKATREAYAEQFKVGKRTLLDLLDSQTELYTAQIDNVEGYYDEIFFRFRIVNAEGLLLKYLDAKIPKCVSRNDCLRLVGDKFGSRKYPSKSNSKKSRELVDKSGALVLKSSGPANKIVTSKSVADKDTTKLAASNDITKSTESQNTSKVAGIKSKSAIPKININQNIISKPHFAIQTAAFSDKENATIFANKLRDKGYNAIYAKSGDLYKVIVDGLAEQSEAEAMKSKLATAMNIKGYVVRIG